MFRTCKHCGLFSLHGEYCAGCGKHLNSKPFISARQFLGLTTAIVVFGLMLGFLVSGSGMLRAPTQLELSLTTAVAGCAGSYTYALELADDEGAVANAPVTITVDGRLLERLRTDQNGRLTATHDYPASWCGNQKRIRAVYAGTAFHERASGSAILIARIPTTLELTAQRVGTNTAFTLALADSEGIPLVGEVVRLSSGSRDLYAVTNNNGNAYITTQLQEQEEMRGVFVGDESYMPAHATPAALTFVDTVELLQQHVVGISHSAGSGAGVIIKHADDMTYVLTNRHVIGNATMVMVHGETEVVAAQVFVAPHGIDLAVLELNGTHGVPATIASRYQQGETVIAIGSPLGLRGSVSTGVLSNSMIDALNDWEVVVLQTDAPINPGSSGGGLFSADGLLLGITTAKISAAEGIGFAIDARTIALLPSIQQWDSRAFS